MLVDRQKKSKRIFISAYACSPLKGSEASVGWSWIVRVSSLFPNYHFIVATEEREFKEDIITYTGLNTLKNVQFVFVPRKRNRKLENISTLMFYISYYLTYRKWHKKVLGEFRYLNELESIDIVHHLNMIGFREPGFLYRINGVKYIHGPVGGGGIIDKDALRLINNRKVRAFYFLYNIVNVLQKNHHFRWKKAVSKSQDLLMSNTANKQFFNKQNSTIYIASDYKLPDEIEVTGATVLTWVGAFQDRKLLDLFLEIVDHPSILNSVDSIQIFGDFIHGNEFSKSVRTVSSSQISFNGWAPKAVVEESLKGSRIFCTTSIREGTPVSIIEAYNAGCCVIGLKTGGVEDMVDSSFLVPYDQDREIIVREYRNLILDNLRTPKFGIPYYLTDKYRNSVIKKIYS